MSVPTPTLSQLFINGEFVPAADGATMPVINPATGLEFFRVSAAGPSDVDRAVRAARAAFPAYAALSGRERAGFLRRIADGLQAKFDRISKLEVLDNGKPLPEAEGDINDSIECFRYYATLAEDLDLHRHEGSNLPDGFAGYVRREPVGVAAAVIPWNYPMLMAAWKIAPCLASGSCMVMKPSEVTPITILELCQVCVEAGLPAGVLNVVNGTGVGAGAPLSAHPGVDKVAFTGSVMTGQRVMMACAQDVKNVSLELGGKSPMVVFDDADVDEAVEWIMFGIFFNQGQVCSATSRLIIQNGIADRVLARLVEHANALPIGDGFTPGVKLGPIVNEAQYNKVLEFIQGAVKQGATVLCGGGRAPGKPHGYFVQPTVLANVTTNMTVWKEEIFGPVLSVIRFNTEDEALALANDTEFGLAAAVMSKNQARCTRMAHAIRAGTVWINCSQPSFCSAPWGGFGKSGIGRELGRWGLDNYLEAKQVMQYTASKPFGWYVDFSSKL